MKMTNHGNQRIYKMWAPFYDALAGRLYQSGRRQAVAKLNLQAGDNVLLVGVRLRRVRRNRNTRNHDRGNNAQDGHDRQELEQREPAILTCLTNFHAYVLSETQ